MRLDDEYPSLVGRKPATPSCAVVADQHARRVVPGCPAEERSIAATTGERVYVCRDLAGFSVLMLKLEKSRKRQFGKGTGLTFRRPMPCGPTTWPES